MTKYLVCIQVEDGEFSGLALIDCRSEAMYSGGDKLKNRVATGGNLTGFINNPNISRISLTEEKFYEILNEEYKTIKKDFLSWFKKHKFDELVNAV